ncbi:MAG: arylamine N-acetyltransferase family protein [Methylocella sp.]
MEEVTETAIGLDAYFSRIGYLGGRKPTLETLEKIVARHTEAIPFENLNPLLRWHVRLDPASLEEKMVRGGRGGYCYEQNLLLKSALNALGYRVTCLAARVLWNVPEGAITPRTHMLLRIDMGEPPLIVDVGFGGLTLTGVLRLEPDAEQPTPHEPFRLVRAGEDFIMQANIGKLWKTLYCFDLQPQFLPDYEVTNWYLLNHPNSHFIHGLMAARPAQDRRYALRNNEFAVHHLGGKTERKILSTIAELREALQDAFRLTLPGAPELDIALGRLILQARIE